MLLQAPKEIANDEVRKISRGLIFFEKSKNLRNREN